MAIKEDAIRAMDEWYEALKPHADKLPAKGSIQTALHILNRLRTTYDLDVASHVAEGESQIMGLSAASIQKVLAEFGEKRQLSATGGRSNRGGRGVAARLLETLKPLNLDKLKSPVREDVLKTMQRHLVTRYVPKYFAVKRVKAVFNSASTTVRFIEMILSNAQDSRKAGAVAEYLVGAKLELRFPGKEIRNKPFSSADAPGGYSGDFEIGSTVFHVTMAPMHGLFLKIIGNLERGLRVYLIVPELQGVWLIFLARGGSCRFLWNHPLEFHHG